VSEFKKYIVFKGRVISKGIAEGEALICDDYISFYGGVDPESGIIVEKGHILEGVSITDKVLIFRGGKGSTVGSYIIYRLAKNKHAPKAFICIKAEPIVAIGAIISGIPLIDRVDESIFKIIKNGDWISVDGYNGVIKCFKQK